MTDNEIIKALECCAGDDGCDVCPMYKPSSECITELQGKVLDLINRQRVEIKNQSANIRNLTAENLQMIACIKTLKAEAIKEFAERLKEQYEIWDDDEYYFNYVTTDQIDNLVKEMVGEG